METASWQTKCVARGTLWPDGGTTCVRKTAVTDCEKQDTGLCSLDLIASFSGLMKMRSERMHHLKGNKSLIKHFLVVNFSNVFSFKFSRYFLAIPKKSF